MMMTTTTRTCGFAFTTTGRHCANRVADGVPWCRAGHPCTVSGGLDDELQAALDRSGVGPHQSIRPGCGRRVASRNRQATELVRQAMASEDAERLGLRAEHMLADSVTALTLLGDPGASPGARAAVIQRFGRVGAILVLGYEERWARQRRLADGIADASDIHGGSDVERIVRDFAHLDAHRLYGLLCEIDREDGRAADDANANAHRWLHATYAVAARDGTAATHCAYMRALDLVMRLVRPMVAS